MQCKRNMEVLKGDKQLIEAWWVSESVMVYHHHFGSSQAEHCRLGCIMPAAIWLWMGLLRETQAGANLQKTLPACLRMRMTCSSILWLCVRAATVFLQSCDTYYKYYMYHICFPLCWVHPQGHHSFRQYLVLHGKIEICRVFFLEFKDMDWLQEFLQLSQPGLETIGMFGMNRDLPWDASWTRRNFVCKHNYCLANDELSRALTTAERLFSCCYNCHWLTSSYDIFSPIMLHC